MQRQTAEDVMAILNTTFLKSLKWKFLFQRVEQGIAAKDLRAVQRWGKYLGNELNGKHFEQWMSQFPGLSFSPYIIELFYFADTPTQKHVFEMAARYQRSYYCQAWAQRIVREDFLVSLLRWHHNDIIKSVVSYYDPTFLTWVGMRFNRSDIYEQFYHMADHDQVRKMLEKRVFEEQEHTYWDLDYYKNQRTANFAILEQLQRKKLHNLVGKLGTTQRRKL